MKTDILNKASRAFHKVGFTLKKHSPEILMVTGIAGVIGSAVMACQATTKVSGIIEEHNQKLNDIQAVLENEEISAEEYSEEDSKKDTAIVFVQTGVELVKLYGPSVALGALSIGCILASNNILKQRNVALAAAYTTIDNSFKEYRNRVVERFGKQIDKELKYNIKSKEIDVVEVNEKGEEKIVKKTIANGEKSEYARFFEKYTRDSKGNVIPNTFWEDNNEYNLLFLKNQERYANDLLRTKGFLFLNDVYRMLGIPESQAGQIVGWVYDKDGDNSGDNYISFGLFDDQMSYSDFIYGNDNGILLDFNVDGNIWENM